MSKRFVHIGQVKPGLHFQDDSYSFGERRRRQLRAPSHRFSAWWKAASPFDRFVRLWWWGVCAIVGLSAGIALAVVLTLTVRGFLSGS